MRDKMILKIGAKVFYKFYIFTRVKFNYNTSRKMSIRL